MTSGKFGPPIGSSASGDDPFGYFGGAQTPALPAQANQFGGPAPSPNAVAGAPASPFGAPEGYPAPQPFASGPPFAEPPKPSRGFRVSKVVIGVVALAVVGAGFFGWNVYQRNRPLDMPTTFAGQALNADPRMEALDAAIVTSMREKNQNIKVDAKIYGTGASAVVLGVARAGENLSQDLVSPDMLAATKVGDATCAQEKTGSTTICVRTATNLTVVVVTVAGQPAATAAMVDLAWPMF